MLSFIGAQATSGAWIFALLQMDSARDHVHTDPMRHLLAPIALLSAAAPSWANAQEEWAGRYVLVTGPDAAGELQLEEDGSFRFGLIAGALDLWAKGRWSPADQGIVLRTEPRPVAPVFTLVSAEPGERGGPLSIKVTWPNGEGIPGIDFHIVRDGLEPVHGYTQYDGWQSEPGEDGRVVSIQLSEPIYDAVSPVFDVPANARNFTFTLTPNDMGVADFDNAPAERTADGLRINWRGGELRFVRRK